MKIILLSLLLLPLSSIGDIDTIARAIATGQAAVLEKYLDSTVEVALPGQEDIYDKEQAITLLRQFFEKSIPKSFTEVHQGASKGNDSLYYIGNLSTNSGNYRWYMFLRIENGKYLIQEIRINKA